MWEKVCRLIFGDRSGIGMESAILSSGSVAIKTTTLTGQMVGMYIATKNRDIGSFSGINTSLPAPVPKVIQGVTTHDPPTAKGKVSEKLGG